MRSALWWTTSNSVRTADSRETAKLLWKVRQAIGWDQAAWQWRFNHRHAAWHSEAFKALSTLQQNDHQQCVACTPTTLKKLKEISQSLDYLKQNTRDTLQDTKITYRDVRITQQRKAPLCDSCSKDTVWCKIPMLFRHFRHFFEEWSTSKEMVGILLPTRILVAYEFFHRKFLSDFFWNMDQVYNFWDFSEHRLRPWRRGSLASIA
jgi:hypothetical protein